MAKTSYRVEFSLTDVTARKDSSYYSDYKQDFSNLSLFNLEDEEPEQPKAATLEEGFTWLDGTFEEFPDNAEGLEYYYWSRDMSNEDGEFETPQTLQINFTEEHSSNGLTFYFYEPTNEYPDLIEVRWYNDYGTIINAARFTPDNWEYRLSSGVLGYTKIEIDFLHTNNPYRFIKLTEIVFGVEKIFDDDQNVSATVNESADPISAEIAVNTFDLNIFSNEDEFSPLNPKGVFAYLQTRQPMKVYAYWNDAELFMGTYYLESWSDITETGLTFKCVDIIGVIDKTVFMGGLYNNVLAGDIVAEIMESAGAPYEIESALANQQLTGHIPICTHREALQQVAIAIGAIVDTSRSDHVKFQSFPEIPTATIYKSKKGVGGTIDLRELITAVSVVAHTYTLSGEAKELSKSIFASGEYEITFSNPSYITGITGAEILQSNVNYALIKVSNGGEVVVTGREYIDYQQTITAGGKTPSNIVANTRDIKEATLISKSNAGTIAKRIYDYYQNRYETEFTQLPSNNVVGMMAIVECLRDEKLKGFIEQMNISLTGGLLAKTKVALAYQIKQHDGFYFGELFMGEEIGVM